MKRALPWVLLVAVAGFVGWKMHSSHFDWAGFGRSLRMADWRLILAAVLVIYSMNFLRALRWAVFLRPAYKAAGVRRVGWLGLVGSQVVGFTGLAIFGRIGELIRPLLVSRRTGMTFASQVAVVAVERVFDLGAFALIFAGNLVLSPSLDQLPHHEYFRRVGLAIAGMTLVLVIFVAAVRLAGPVVARLMERAVGVISAKAGAAVSEKVLAFREGLVVIDGVGDFLAAAGISVAIWGGIALSYMLAMRAFPAPVHDLTVAYGLILMGFSVVGGVVQLPGVGGGAQVGTISALTLLFGVPNELAVSAGLMIWLITSMSIIPVGLIYAQVEGISLRQVAERSEAAEVG